jgi:hypothetical protein
VKTNTTNDNAPAPTLEGGCHCGAVRFRVTSEAREAISCNCSICTMKAFVHLIVPEAAFELVRGEEVLATYRFNTGVAKHHFCRVCGVHPFYRPRSHPDHVDVNVNCLDDEVARTRFAVAPFDGRNWEQNIDELTSRGRRPSSTR